MQDHIKTIKAYFSSLSREVWIWIGALTALAIADTNGAHFEVCPIALAGLDWCPGCGLGRSIGLLFHGDWIDSFHMHPLGAVALLLIVYRIFQLGLDQYGFIKKTRTL